MDTVSVGCAVLVSLEGKSSVGATVVSGVAMRCALSRAANPSGVRGYVGRAFQKNDDANGKQYHSDKEDAADNRFVAIRRWVCHIVLSQRVIFVKSRIEAGFV